MSLVDDLRELNELRDSGALSDEEFERAKAQLLDGKGLHPTSMRSDLPLLSKSELVDQAVDEITRRRRMSRLIRIVVLVGLLLLFQAFKLAFQN